MRLFSNFSWAWLGLVATNDQDLVIKCWRVVESRGLKPNDPNFIPMVRAELARSMVA